MFLAGLGKKLFKTEVMNKAADEAITVMKRWTQAVKVRVLAPLLDLLLLAYVWAAANASYAFFRFGTVEFNLVPWQWMVPTVIAAAAVWSAWDQTLGLKLVRHLPPRMSLGTRAFYALFWPLFPLTIFTALFDKDGRSPAEILTESSVYEVTTTIHRPWYRTLTGWVIVFVLFFTLGTAIGVTRVDPTQFVKRFDKVIKYWRAIFSPAWQLAPLGVKLLAETLFMAIMATAFAIPFAAVLSFFAARNLMRGPIGRPIYIILRAIGSFTRSVDAIIWAIIFAVWVGTGSFAGVLALFVHSIVDLMKLYAEQIESIDPGPVEAITATGANRLQVLRYAVIPQIINPFLSFTLYRWDINVRMATVVGLVGGGGIGFRLAWYLGSYAFREAAVLTLLIVVMVWTIDWISARLRERLS